MKWLLTAILVIAAAASAFSLVLLKIGNMMLEGWSRNDPVVLLALGAIVLVTLAGLVMAFKVQPSAANYWLAACSVLVVVAAVVPYTIDAGQKAEREAQRAEDNRAYQAKFLADLEARKKDVETRIAERRPYTPAEAEAFVEFVKRSNLYYVNGPDHMPAAMSLLQSALEAKILDPNAPVRDRLRADVGNVPLYLRLYRELRQTPWQSLRSQDWNILLLLVANGADLSVPLAEPLVADLRKTAVPQFGGLYIDLQ